MTTTCPQLEPGEPALARATLYRLCAQAFRHPGPSWREEWDQIARGVGTALEVLALEDRVRPAATRSLPPVLFEAFDLLWAASRDEARIRDAHARLIGHSPRAGTTPYETEWTGSSGEILQYHLLADLSGFYHAFGLELAPGCGERADHLALELCFLSFLCLKEARTVADGGEEHAVVREAERRFLDEHLLSWADAYGARVEREDPHGFHGQAARFLRAFLGAERRRFELGDHEPRELSESSLALEDCCVGCDLARGCAGPAAHESVPT
jgi:TorA maturation chaperone TorD